MSSDLERTGRAMGVAPVLRAGVTKCITDAELSMSSAMHGTFGVPIT